MRGLEVPWWIAGGWALDLFAGRQTRAHADIEVSIFRADEAKLRRQLSGWEFFVADAGALTPLRVDDEPLPAAAHEMWSRVRGHDAWQIEVLIEEREGDRWVYRRHPRIGGTCAISAASATRASRTQPDVQLLYKSKSSRA